MDEYILLFLRALAVTVAIETAVIAAFFFQLKRRGFSRGLVTRVLVAGVVSSCVTLPFIWFAFPPIIMNRAFFLIAAEIFACIAEAPIIGSIVKTTRFEAIAVSLGANGVSFIFGYLMGIS